MDPKAKHWDDDRVVAAARAKLRSHFQYHQPIRVMARLGLAIHEFAGNHSAARRRKAAPREVRSMRSHLARLQRTGIVHVRRGEVASLRDLVLLLDRFLDDRALHEMEWDDFVSWEPSNPTIESARQRIAQTEPLFFSGKQQDRESGTTVVIEERNRIAALCGLSARDTPT